MIIKELPLINKNSIKSVLMQGDLLLQEWKQAKQTCRKIIEICKQTHLGKGNVQGRILAPGEKQTNKQFINVYDVVYRLCLSKEKQQNRVLMVYKDYKDLLKTALLQMAPLLNGEKDIYKLGALYKIWQAYTDMTRRLNNMFAYLNRSFHFKNDKIQDLERTSVNLIAETFFNQHSVAEYTILYFKQIDRIRKNTDFSNTKLLSNLVTMFYSIHIKILKHASNKKIRTLYTQHYSLYQKTARQYYIRRFKTLKQLSPSEYITEINILYHLQQKIAESCFVITAQTLINKQFSEQMLNRYKDIFLKSEFGLKFILKQGQTQTLKLIVELYLKLTKSLDGFKQQFEQYVFEEMRNHINQSQLQLSQKKSIANYCNFIEKIIRKNQELITILQSINVVGDFVPYFKSGIEKAFQQSKTQIKIQELLAVYTDIKFRVEMNESQFQVQVKNIIFIFNCIQNKDLFLLKYSQKFAKRILLINQSSLRSHEMFISNLKMNCGARYTQSLETIIVEYRLSIQKEENIKQICERQKVNINLGLKVFSQGAWPTRTIFEVPIEFLPREIQLANECITQFRVNFLNKKNIKTSGLESKIRWIYYFDPQINNKNQTCYFDTNLVQAAIVNYIYKNRPHRVAYQTLQQLFNTIVTPQLLKECINKMIEVADNLLIRQNDEAQIYISFNQQMKSNKKLISYDQGSSQQEEKLFNNHDLAKDRQIVLDANISKIMKAKKVLYFKQLIEQTIKMIKVFVPLQKDVKLSIDRLIAKELLQRDQKDRQLIRYKD